MVARKIISEFIPKMVEMYEKDLIPISEIAVVFRVSRVAVFKRLRAAGVDTSKRLRKTECYNCGKEILRERKSGADDEVPYVFTGMLL